MICLMICGDSGTGKTTLTNLLNDSLSNSVVLECDRYHKWERGDPSWERLTHLNPEANETDLMCRDVQTLKEGKSISRRDYSHTTGKFTETEEILSSDHIIVCGLHAFLCSQDSHDIKVFMDTDDILKVQWKIARDTGRRGYTLEEVRRQIDKRKKEYTDFVEPFMSESDIIVNFSSESDHYTDSIKGIGRFLRVFIQEKHELTNILSRFNNLGVDYVLSSESSRSNFWQIDIKHMQGGYYYDYIVVCILEILNQNASH